MNIYPVDKKDNALYRDVLPEDTLLNEVFIVAARDDEAEDTPLVGILSVSFGAPGVCELEYLYVLKDYRGRGIGAAMLRLSCEILRAAGVEMVRTSFERDDELTALMECLSQADFSLTSVSTLSGASISAVKSRIDGFRKGADIKGIVPLSELSDEKWLRCIEDYCDSLHEKGIPVLIGSREEYAADLSMAALDPAGKCRGFVLLSQAANDISVDYLWSADSRGKVMMSLLIAACDAIASDGDLFFDAAYPNAARLAKKLLGDDLHETGEIVTMCRNI